APSAIAADFGRDGGLLARNGWVTLREVLLGYALAAACGVAIGVLLHASAAVRRAVYPILLASQTVPVVVLAPVLAIALGYDLARIFAAIVILSAISLVLFALVGALERRAAPWAREERRVA